VVVLTLVMHQEFYIRTAARKEDTKAMAVEQIDYSVMGSNLVKINLQIIQMIRRDQQCFAEHVHCCL
jgi:hypothetical protein